MQRDNHGCNVPRDRIANEISWIDDTDTENKYFDDLSGEPLDPEMAKEARREEIQEYHKHGVYRKVPIALCWEKTGTRPIQTKWTDINKGDARNPEYRSRLVAKEVAYKKRDDLFAATPPL